MCFLSGPFLRAPKGELVLERLPQGMAPSILLGAQTWPSSRSSSAGFSLKGEAAGGPVGLFPQGSAPDGGAFLPSGGLAALTAWATSVGIPEWTGIFQGSLQLPVPTMQTPAEFWIHSKF